MTDKLIMRNPKYFYLLPCPALVQASWKTHLEIAFKIGCDKKRNSNNKVFLPIKKYLIYNII